SRGLLGAPAAVGPGEIAHRLHAHDPPRPAAPIRGIRARAALVPPRLHPPALGRGDRSLARRNPRSAGRHNPAPGDIGAARRPRLLKNPGGGTPDAANPVLDTRAGGRYSGRRTRISHVLWNCTFAEWGMMTRSL